MQSCLTDKKLATLCAQKYPPKIDTVTIKGSEIVKIDTILEYVATVQVQDSVKCPPSKVDTIIEYAASVDCPPTKIIKVTNRVTDTIKIQIENTARLDSIKIALSDTCSITKSLRGEIQKKEISIDKWKVIAIVSIFINFLFILFFMYLWRNSK